MISLALMLDSMVLMLHVVIAGLGILGIVHLCLDLVELDAELSMLHWHPLGFSSTYVFAVHLHSLATELKVLRQIIGHLCSLATELKVLTRIAALLFSSA